MPKIVASRKYDYYGYPRPRQIRGILSAKGFARGATVSAAVRTGTHVYTGRLRIL